MKGLSVPIDIGEGRPIVLLHGFAMLPSTYMRTAELLAPRARVIIPDLFAIRGPWKYERVLDSFAATLDDLSLERVSLLGHSFGGSIELGYAALNPERVTEVVFSDTLAVSHEWGLADEALRHPLGLLQLATPQAASAFAISWIRHPRQLAAAGWWGFLSKRQDAIGSIAADAIPAHVLWANRDSILSRTDGEAFAAEMHATFTVAESPDGRPIDHDWMFMEPELFVSHLEKIGMRALTSSGPH